MKGRKEEKRRNLSFSGSAGLQIWDLSGPGSQSGGGEEKKRRGEEEEKICMRLQQRLENSR